MSEEFKYLSKIGTEIEAGFLKERNDLKNDDSLEGNSFLRPVVCYGELNSPPFDNKEDLFNYIKESYNGLVTSPKCAIQFHVSFKSLSLYERMMNRGFFNCFIEYITKWAEENSIRNEYFWERLNGKNKYCRKEFIPQKQLFIKHVDGQVIEERRTILNYCWKKLKTIEFRLFPTFECAETSISAANAVIDCVESYLDKNPVEPVKEIEEEIAIDEKEININVPPSVIKLKPYNFYAKRGGKIKLNTKLPEEKEHKKLSIEEFDNYKAPVLDLDYLNELFIKEKEQKEVPF